MEKINFTNNQVPAINGTNLNQLQTNVETAIKEQIITVSYNTGTLTLSANSSTNSNIATSVPEGYSWLGYIITDNGWNADILSSIIKSDETKCVVNAYNIGSAQKTPTITIKGIYVKK